MNNSASHFGAMPRLLDETEIESLARQPGFDAALIRKLRQHRRRTFALYLSELSAEFHLLEREALGHAANDPGADAAFAESVLKIKFRFTVSVFLLRTSLWLPPNALPGMRQMAADLIGSVEPLLLPRSR